MLTSIAWGEREVEVRIMRGDKGYSGGQDCLKRQEKNCIWNTDGSLALPRGGGASIVDEDRRNHAD